MKNYFYEFKKKLPEPSIMMAARLFFFWLLPVLLCPTDDFLCFFSSANVALPPARCPLRFPDG
jgi:hypothetical protein